MESASLPVPFVLELDEVHLWRVSLAGSEECVRAFTQTLSSDERQRADRFQFETHRRRFVMGRGVLRALLGRYLGRPPADLEFGYGPFGKPSLAESPDGRAIFFNVSRSDDFALCAITWAGEIGIDVERVRAIPEWQEIAHRILTRDHDAAPPATVDEFFREWTRHEARLKATGLGLGDSPTAERKWAVHSLSIDRDLLAAVALPDGVRHITCWNWRVPHAG